jgi:hypothetical protein
MRQDPADLNDWDDRYPDFVRHRTQLTEAYGRIGMDSAVRWRLVYERAEIAFENKGVGPVDISKVLMRDLQEKLLEYV